MTPMNRYQRVECGVTLLELLVALSIMALLSVATLVAWRVGASAHEKALGAVESSRKDAAVREFIVKQISGMVPVKPWTNVGYPNAFFQGMPDGMRFVSRYSLYDRTRGGLLLAEYRLLTNGDRTQLLYREYALNSLDDLKRVRLDKLSTFSEQPLLFNALDDGKHVLNDATEVTEGTWLVLLSDLAESHIQYFVDAEGAGRGAWVSSWLGAGGYLPMGLVIRAKVKRASNVLTEAALAATIPNYQRPAESLPLYYF